MICFINRLFPHVESKVTFIRCSSFYLDKILSTLFNLCYLLSALTRKTFVARSQPALDKRLQQREHPYTYIGIKQEIHPVCVFFHPIRDVLLVSGCVFAQRLRLSELMPPKYLVLSLGCSVDSCIGPETVNRLCQPSKHLLCWRICILLSSFRQIARWLM